MAKYDKYVEYKDSGVEWIGEIPNHWTTCSLSKLFSIKAGGDVDLRNFSEDQSNEYLYPIYTNANDAKSVYGYSKVANYKANSITVSGRGEVGFAVYRNHAFDAIIRLLVLSPQKKCEPKFFAYFINEVINFRVESSAIGQLSTLQISPYKIVLPSLSEQKSVVDYLDHETAKIDSLIEKQQQLIQLLKEKRQAVISHAVTKGLDPNVPMKDSGVEWLGDVPKHWKISHLKYIASIYGRIGFRGYTVDDIVDEGEGALVLSPSNIIGDRFSLEKRTYLSWKKYYESPEIMVNNNDILLVKTGSTFGKSTIILKKNEPMTINPQMALIKGVSIDPRFLTYLFNSNFIKGCIEVSNTGSGMPTMTQENINNFIILIPTLGEDKLIADFLDREVDQIELIIKKAESAIQLMQERRTALISSAVTGKIDVRNWQNPKNNNEAKTELSA